MLAGFYIPQYLDASLLEPSTFHFEADVIVEAGITIHGDDVVSFDANGENYESNYYHAELSNII